MRMRPSWLILAVLLIPTAAHADDHKADLSGGGGRAWGSSLGGIQFGGSRTLSRPAHRNISLAFDGSYHWGVNDGDEDVFSLAGGLHFALPPKHDPRLLPFVHALVGFTHSTALRGIRNGWAGVVGGGVDYLVTRDDNGGGHALRAQLDYQFREGSSDELIRLSFAYVYRLDR